MSASLYEQLMAVVRGRRSVRKFREESVPRDRVERLIEAARWAPSATDRQDWFFSVVESPELKRAMAQAVRHKWQQIIEENSEAGFIEEVRDYVASFADFELAPAVIAVSAARANAVQRKLAGDAAGATAGSFASAAMAAQNLMLAAHALGLATCCMTGGLVAGEELGRLLELTGRRELVCVIALGFPGEQPDPPARKAVDQIARFHE